jgi:hypothetical protein
LWNVTALEIIHLGRTPGGDRFTNFVDELIRAQAFIDGRPSSVIHTNLRTNIGDKGVDTKVDGFVPDSNNTWLKDSSIMQYKASGYSGGEKDFETEINKSFAKECILEGYAYRFCVCDSMPATTKSNWEESLNQLIQEINPDAPKAYVLTADDLAAWASTFPSIILKFFRSNVSNMVFHIDSWGQSIRSLTPDYLSVPEWEGVTRQIHNMLNFSVDITEVLMTIQGEAGVGKTRLVYESLADLKEASSLVVYTNDENFAIQVATMMINDPSITSILIADECSLQGRQSLKNILQGHTSRIRTIAIDNTGDRPSDLTNQFWLEKMAPELLLTVLEKNYPYVSKERLKVYASLSGGFVRLAADLCFYDSQIANEGHVGAGLPNIREYYISRLSREERQVIEAISLLGKVGYKQEVKIQMLSLCNLLDLNPNQVISTARRLHDVPGFIAIAGRYMYVTPELIAQVAFDEAYKRWIQEDPEEFLKSIPENLLQSFLVRVAWSGREEVRRQIGGYFRRWFSTLKPSDLAEVKKVDQIEELVEGDPFTFLPMLRNLIELASDNDLQKVTGESTNGRWGTRRSIVWLSERLAGFPEHFMDSEVILRHLALSETEPDISNNATGTWKDLFHINLSGTSLPFNNRFAILRRHILSENPATFDIAIQALSEIFHGHNMRIVGKPVIAGRIVPEQWSPKNLGEYKACLEESLDLLVEMTMNQGNPHHVRSALNIGLLHLRNLLRYGFIEKLKHLFSSNWDEFISRSDLIKEIEEFIHFDCENGNQVSICQDAKDWLEEIKPSDLSGRLRALVGVDNWHYSILDRDESWKEELNKLSKELIHDRTILEQNLEWLFSSDAKSSFNLGVELGSLDHKHSLFNLLLKAAVDFKATSLTRGYLSSSIDADEDYLDDINEIFDKMQIENPEIALDLFMVGGDKTKAFERSMSLFDKGILQPFHLGAFIYGVGDRKLTPDETASILDKLLPFAYKGDDSANRLIYTLIFKLLRSIKQSEEKILADDLKEVILCIVDSLKPANSRSLYEWEQILNSLINFNTEQVIKILCKYIGHEDYSLDKHASSLLLTIAKEHPQMVMNILGKVLIDQEKSVRFFIRKYDKLIHAISPEIVISWVEQNGFEAAIKLARHLPLPYIDENSQPKVPPLTEYILSKFEGEERLFNEFIAGAHSFQMYSGDIAEQYEAEAEVAKRFLDHSLKRVREWAVYEIDNLEFQAKHWRIRNEEMDLK